MAKCELPKGILSLSGTLGNIVFKTYRRPNGTTETRAYRKPANQRTTPVTDKECAARTRFSRMAQEVARRIREGDQRPKNLIWAEVKKNIDS